MRTAQRFGRVLAALCLIAPASPARAGDDPKARFEALKASQVEAKDRYHAELKASKTGDATEAATDRYLKATAENTDGLLDLARENPKAPFAVDALKFVLENARAGPGDQSYRAIAMLLRDHVADPGMGEVCGRVFFIVHAPEAGQLVRAVAERHPSRGDRGLACHTLATYLQLQARMVRRVRNDPSKLDDYVHERHKAATARFVKEANPDSLDREAEAVLERVAAEFADVKDGYDGRPLGEIARGELFALRSLSVGRTAPEIQGTDAGGKAFALSDYRGKVVVLTFSGDWCGPCVGMYPQEREMVGRHEGAAFAFLSVNTDADLATLQQATASGEITWRCWWDGGVAGPITTRWGVRSFPTIFVLDREGVIRHKDLRGEALDRAVERLVGEGG